MISFCNVNFKITYIKLLLYLPRANELIVNSSISHQSVHVTDRHLNSQVKIKVCPCIVVHWGILGWGLLRLLFINFSVREIFNVMKVPIKIF